MKTKEFIEQHLKKIYENCPVYFDVQENSIIIKNLITKELKNEWDKNESELRQIRIKIKEAQSMGITDLPEPPPQHWEDIYEDEKYQWGENYFKWLITKLNEWEANQNGRVENISSLIIFLEWIVAEEERFMREEEEAQKNAQSEIIKNILLQAIDLKLEEFNDELKELNKKRQECEKQLQKVEISKSKLKRKEEKYNKQIERLKNGETIESDKDVESEDEFLPEEENKVRNILLIGRTGSGKSTLANVLVNKNGEFEEVFKESSRSISETKSIQTEEFIIDIRKDKKEKIHYLVIDTAGLGDTQLSNKDILKLLQDLVPIIKQNGLNQVLFVTGGRFTQSEIDTYKLLESVLFDKGVIGYTTIVRTNFEDFEDNKAREEDEKNLRKENPEIFKILQASKIIYVDNPRIVGRSAITNREIRKESRKRLLTHLGTCQDNYYPEDLENLSKRINDYVTSEEELKKEIELKEKKIQEEQTELQKEVERIQAQKDCELKIVERNSKRQTQDLKKQNQRRSEATRQELDEVHRLQLQKSREVHDKEFEEVRRTIQNNLSQIRSSYGYVRVGEPVCRYGHDKDIRTYDKSSSIIPDYQSDIIGHIYCPTCGETQYNWTLRDAKNYSLDEWSKKNSQQAEERRRKMQEVINKQNKKEQEIVAKINQEKANREAESIKNIQKLKSLQEQVESQQKKVKEEIIKQQKQLIEEKITSKSQEKIDRLKKELVKKEQELNEHKKKIKSQRDSALQKLYAYIEERR